MGHHDHHHHHGETGNIKIAFFLNLAFTVIEIIGGLYTNSMAVISDALHDLGDSLSLGLAWYFQNLSQKKSNTSFSYGYRRFSLVGAIINAMVLLMGSVFILMKTIPRLLIPEAPDINGMILLAILGILVNGAAVLRLKKGHSINEKVVSLHLLEDVLGWIAVLMGAVIMYFFKWPIIDPILAVLITCFVLFNIYKNLKQVFNIFLQGVPSGTNTEEVKQYLLKMDEVLKIHDLHIWSLDGEYNILTVHLVINRNDRIQDLEDLKTKIRKGLHNLGIEHATLEFETKEESCIFVKC